jgi:adenine-specific DNA methylase
MNTLTDDQIEFICNYWTQRERLTDRLQRMYLKDTGFYSAMYDPSDDDDDDYYTNQKQREHDRLMEEIERIKMDVEELDQNYEETIISYGLQLLDRDMDEELFQFINN